MSGEEQSIGIAARVSIVSRIKSTRSKRRRTKIIKRSSIVQKLSRRMELLEENHEQMVFVLDDYISKFMSTEQSDELINKCMEDICDAK